MKVLKDGIREQICTIQLEMLNSAVYNLEEREHLIILQ